MYQKPPNFVPLSQPESREKGQSLLEMAIAVIILLVLIAGIIDLGRLFFTYIAIREAAQEGAAFASICPPDGADNKLKIAGHVKNSSQFPVNLNSPNIFVSASFTEVPTPGSQVYVSVTYQNFQFITPFLSNLLDGDITADAHDVSLQFECPDE